MGYMVRVEGMGQHMVIPRILSDCLLHKVYSLLPVAYCLLLPGDSPNIKRLPTYCLLHTAYYVLFSAHCMAPSRKASQQC